MEYSVLMSVYYKEKPEYLRESMNSIYIQTVPTNDFVLVCDGPLNAELDKVIAEMHEKFGDRLKVHRLEQNRGLGNALNIGIKECRNELVARMDSDDISRPDRCEQQLKVFKRHPDLSIISGTVEEFSTFTEQVSVRRVLPESNEDIVQFAKRRNPFNHPCVMYRKRDVEAAGGYIDFPLLEDYSLWIRMILIGCQGYNIQEPLIWMRAGNGMYHRRSGIAYGKSQKRLFKFMYENGFITIQEYRTAVAERTIISVVPNSVRVILYRYFLRK